MPYPDNYVAANAPDEGYEPLVQEAIDREEAAEQILDKVQEWLKILILNDFEESIGKLEDFADELHRESTGLVDDARETAAEIKARRRY